jgi:hypothetical protein
MKTILAAALVAALVGCSTVPQPTTSSKWNTATIEMHWLKKQEVGETCHQLGLPNAEFNGCARSKPNSNICEIYMAEPTSFDDKFPLEILGHETWHCFGAVH